MQDQLGMDWLCFLCKAQIQESKGCRDTPEASAAAPFPVKTSAFAATVGQHACNRETVLIVWPTDAYRRRIFLQPWGLYLVAEAGCLESLQIDVSAGIITVMFEEPDMLLSSQNRLRVEQTSELDHHQQTGVCVSGDPSGVASNLNRCSEKSDTKQQHQGPEDRSGMAAVRHLMQISGAAAEGSKDRRQKVSSETLTLQVIARWQSVT